MHLGCLRVCTYLGSCGRLWRSGEQFTIGKQQRRLATTFNSLLSNQRRFQKEFFCASQEDYNQHVQIVCSPNLCQGRKFRKKHLSNPQCQYQLLDIAWKDSRVTKDTLCRLIFSVRRSTIWQLVYVTSAQRVGSGVSKSSKNGVFYKSSYLRFDFFISMQN